MYTPACLLKLCSWPCEQPGQELLILVVQPTLRRVDPGKGPVQTLEVDEGLWGQGILGSWVLEACQCGLGSVGP